MSRSLRGGADGRMDALVAAAPAQVAGHGVGDLLVGRRGLLLQERRRLHDLPALAVAALRYTDLAPRDLHRMLALRVEPLDRHDGLPADIRHRDAAGAHRLAVHVHGARAAQRDAAAE